MIKRSNFMTDIFISYSKHDKDLVFSICNYLEKNGLTCWIAPRNIPPGSEYAAEIIKGIENCKLFLLMYSDTANQSRHVLREVGRAVHFNLPIIAYRITKAKPTKSMEYFLETIQWLDAPYKECTSPETLLQAIKNVLDQKDIPVSTASVSAHSSPLDILHKYSTYIAGVLLVTVIVLVLTIFKLNKNNPALNTQASQLLVENDTQDELSPSTDSPLAEASLEPSVEPSADIPTNSATNASADTPTDSPSNTSSNNTETPNINSSNAFSDPEPNAVIVSNAPPSSINGSTDVPTAGSTQDKQQPVAPIPEKKQIKVGDYIQLGTYSPFYAAEHEDDKIQWLVLNVDENAGTALCLSSHILDFKCFDGAESGSYGSDKEGNRYTKGNSYTAAQLCEFFGNNDWSTSNIRTWLNSGQAQVSYSDAPPTNNLTHGANGYSSHPGFLYHFTNHEKSLICSRTNSTPGTQLDPNSKTTTDKVFLLSQSEVEKYLVQQNFVVYATPTKAAISSERENIYACSVDRGYNTFPWCLRTPDSSTSTDVLLVTNGTDWDNGRSQEIACYCCLGIRPAMVIKFGGQSLSGDGSQDNPYILN